MAKTSKTLLEAFTKAKENFNKAGLTNKATAMQALRLALDNYYVSKQTESSVGLRLEDLDTLLRKALKLDFYVYWYGVKTGCFIDGLLSRDALPEADRETLRKTLSHPLNALLFNQIVDWMDKSASNQWRELCSRTIHMAEAEFVVIPAPAAAAGAAAAAPTPALETATTHGATESKEPDGASASLSVDVGSEADEAPYSGVTFPRAPYPRDHSYAVFCWAAYQAPGAIPDFIKTHCQEPGWELLEYFSVNKGRLMEEAPTHGFAGHVYHKLRTALASFTEGSYVGMVFINRHTHHAVLVHQGESLDNPGSLKASIESVMKAEVSFHQACSIEFAEHVIALCQKRGFNLSVSGHGLGGWLAHLTVFHAHDGVLKYPDIRCVSFDHSGFNRMAAGLESHIEGGDRARVAVDDLNTVTYVTYPNLINCLNAPRGTVYRITPPLSGSWFKPFLMDAHSIEAIAGTLKAIDFPTEHREAVELAPEELRVRVSGGGAAAGVAAAAAAAAASAGLFTMNSGGGGGGAAGGAGGTVASMAYRVHVVREDEDAAAAPRAESRVSTKAQLRLRVEDWPMLDLSKNLEEAQNLASLPKVMSDPLGAGWAALKALYSVGKLAKTTVDALREWKAPTVVGGVEYEGFYNIYASAKDEYHPTTRTGTDDYLLRCRVHYAAREDNPLILELRHVDLDMQAALIELDRVLKTQDFDRLSALTEEEQELVQSFELLPASKENPLPRIKIKESAFRTAQAFYQGMIALRLRLSEAYTESWLSVLTDIITKAEEEKRVAAMKKELLDKLTIRVRAFYQSDECRLIPRAFARDAGAESEDIKQLYVGLSILKEKDYHDTTKAADLSSVAGQPIDLEAIFTEARRAGRGNRLFLEGGAGFGKTTTCQFMVNQWAQGKLFPEFDLVLWIPLREWEAKRKTKDTNYTLSDFIRYKYLGADTSPSEKALLGATLSDHRTKILWLLDGFDEIQPDAMGRKVVDHLESATRIENWLVTSRPNYQHTIRYDFGLEITGFNRKQIEVFIKRYFGLEAELKLAEEAPAAAAAAAAGGAGVSSGGGAAAGAAAAAAAAAADGVGVSTGGGAGGAAAAVAAAAAEITAPVVVEAESKLTQARNLYALLTQNKALLEMARVPILLELFCFCFSETDAVLRKRIASLKQGARLSELYLTCYEKLSRRFLSRTIADEDLRKLSREDFLNRTHIEAYFHEELALLAVQEGKIYELDPALLQRAWDKTKISKGLESDYDANQLVHYGLLRRLGKKLEDKKEMEHSHFFMHRSVQEYFAARAWVRHYFSGNAKEKAQALNLSKSNNALVWQFAAGLLTSAEQIKAFFALLAADTDSLKTEYGSGLLFACYDECDDAILSAELPGLKAELEAYIQTLIHHGKIVHSRKAQYSLLQAFRTEWGSLAAPGRRDPSTIITLLRSLKEFNARDEVILKEALEHDDPEIALLAAQKYLADESWDKCKTRLAFQLLLHRELEVRKYAAARIRSVIPKISLEQEIDLVKVLKHSELTTERRIEMFSYLLSFNYQSSLSTKAAADQKPSVIEVNADGLGEFTPALAKANLALLNSRFPELYNYAALIFSPLDSIIASRRCSAVDALGLLRVSTPEINSNLLALLEHKNGILRGAVVKALDRLGVSTPEINSVLLATLKDEEWEVRRAAAEALGRLGVSTPEINSTLLAALKDSEEYVGVTAAEALDRLGVSTPEINSTLLAALKDSNGYVKRAATKALGQLEVSTPEINSALVAALKDGYEGVREAAIKALSRLEVGTPEINSALLAALTDEDESVREAAAKTLDRLGVSTLEINSTLLAALDGDRYYVRRIAAEALGRLGVSMPEISSPLLAALKGGDRYVKRAAAEALGRLGMTTPVSALEDGDNRYVKRAAAEVLGRLRMSTPEINSALLAALKDSDKYVKRAAAGALGRLGVSTPEINSVLLATLKDEERGVRRTAAEALGRLEVSTPEINSALLAALKDEDESVREAVAKAIKKNKANIKSAMRLLSADKLVKAFYHRSINVDCSCHYQASTVAFAAPLFDYLKTLGAIKNPTLKDYFYLLQTKLQYGGMVSAGLSELQDNSLLLRYAKELAISISMSKAARETLDFVDTSTSVAVSAGHGVAVAPALPALTLHPESWNTKPSVAVKSALELSWPEQCLKRLTVLSMGLNKLKFSDLKALLSKIHEQQARFDNPIQLGVLKQASLVLLCAIFLYRGSEANINSLKQEIIRQKAEFLSLLDFLNIHRAAWTLSTLFGVPAASYAQAKMILDALTQQLTTPEQDACYGLTGCDVLVSSARALLERTVGADVAYPHLSWEERTSPSVAP